MIPALIIIICFIAIIMFIRNTTFVCYYLSQAIRRRKQMKGYNDSYDSFEDYFQWQVKSTAALLEKTASRMNLSGKMVVEVGCGYGGRTPFLISNKGAKHVIATEINPRALEIAEKYIKKYFPSEAASINFRISNGGIAAEDEQADAIVIIDVFEHLNDPEQMLSECYRVLKPGGMLYFGTIGWYHHEASHITSTIPIPWCQVFFTDRVLIKCIRLIQRSNTYVQSVWDKDSNVKDRWDGVTDLRNRPGEYLNKITIHDIKCFCRKSQFEIQEFNIFGYGGRTHKFSRILAPLTKIPLLNEIFHSYIFVTLQKPTSKPI